MDPSISKEFDKIKHNFIYYKTTFKERDSEKNNNLELLCKELFKNIRYSVVNKKDTNEKIVEILNNIINNLESLKNEDITLYNALLETVQLIENRDFTINSVSNAYSNFKEAFGRGQSYISLVKEQ